MKVLRTIVATLALLTGCIFSLSAQNRVVSGQVLDSQQQPVIGAAVMYAGKGDVTDVDGNFSLSVPAGEVTLEVSCLGYVSQSVKVPATQAKVTVMLLEDNMLIEETVVVGYGTQKKVNLTGAITTVDTKDLQDRTAHNLTAMLQGSVPGLNISTSAGNPGSTASLNIRGVTSFNDQEPLVLIDGAVGDMSRVNPNDVESISVIKDAAAAAVYGARGAYGVILITTKAGKDEDGKAKVRYSGRFGWEEPTVSTDFETRGYWSVYTVDKFWQADAGNKYTTYTDYDMAQLLARVNDKVENPARPWIVEDTRFGRRQWVYYCNTDWYHELYRDRHPVQSHSISISGGNKAVKYMLSGGYERQTGIIKVNPDVFQKYNLRAKLDFNVNKYIKMTNNTSFYSSGYEYPGVGDVQDSFTLASRHALASFPLKNPDGSWVYATPMISGSYNVANGRHIVFGNDKDYNINRKTDFSNMTQIVITPVKQFNITANFTYRLYQDRNTNRKTNIVYRQYPDSELEAYTTGAGLDNLSEAVKTYNYLSGNVFATYEDTYKDAHHLTIVAGMNLEDWHSKLVGASGQNLLSEELNDLNLVGPDAEGQMVTSVSGGQNSYALMGFFGRINYDYKGRYLFEVAGRYDGSSRFAKGHRWGFFPSASAGWRISEEPWFAPAKQYVNNLKLRFSFGSLGNQNVSYYSYLRQITKNSWSGDDAYTFGESANNASYTSIGAPVATDLTWETAQQYNLGLDASFFNNRLNFTGEVYIRDTKNMLTAGMTLPSVYGASSPKMNNADLRTSGYELSLSWRDQFKLAGHPFGYSIRGSISDFKSVVTKYKNNDKRLLSDYYEGMRIGEIWGFVVDGLFETDEQAKQYQQEVCDCSPLINSRITGGFRAGDLIYRDLDGDGKLTNGAGTVDDPGDRKILGNSLASLQYGFNVSLDWFGFDVSAFFQGTGNHYWYPAKMNMMFWGPYSYTYTSFLQRDFLDRCWSEENPNAYFPRPRSYSSTGGELKLTNTRYIQNVRYLRFKNLTVGYTIPQKWTKKAGIDKIRIYYSGENLAYWSPLKKNCRYIDPESGYTRNSSDNVADDAMQYPWQRTHMFGIDIVF